MKYLELNQKFGQVGKQFGEKLIYISSDGIEEVLHGYKITDFKGMEPSEATHVKDISAVGVLDWGKAYDLLFGAPIGKPDFTSTINL